MDSSEFEQLQLEVISELCVLSRDILVELCDFLVFAGPKFEHNIAKIWTYSILKAKFLCSRYKRQTKTDRFAASIVKREQKKQDQDEEWILMEIEALQLQLITTEKQSEKDKQENTVTNNMVSGRKKKEKKRAHPTVLHLPHGIGISKYLAKSVIPARKTDSPF